MNPKQRQGYRLKNPEVTFIKKRQTFRSFVIQYIRLVFTKLNKENFALLNQKPFKKNFSKHQATILLVREIKKILLDKYYYKIKKYV